MATNITADIEQLLAELVRITTKIATVVNSTSKSDRDDDANGSLASTANSLSLSATIFAVAAFLIATLQAVLEYSNAGDSNRHKCNESAIGPFAKYVIKQWSLSHWRRKFYYPRIQLEYAYILHLCPGDYDTYEAPAPPKPRKRIHTMTSRINTMSSAVSSAMSNTVFGGVLDKILAPPFLRRFRQPALFESRPRATWAQLFSVNDSLIPVQEIIHSYLDADSISGALDVPAQMVGMASLGMLAIVMGFDSVKVNTEERTIRAFGIDGSLTTEDLAGFGKVVRFQHYRTNYPRRYSFNRKDWMRAGFHLTRGIFNIDALHLTPSDGQDKLKEYNGSYSTMVFMQVQSSGMIKTLNSEIENENRKIRSNAEIYDDIMAIPKETNQAAVVKLQEYISPDDMKYPVIFVTMALAGYPFNFAGFPSRLLLIPFLGQCVQYARNVYGRWENASTFSWERMYSFDLFKTRDTGFNADGVYIDRLYRMGLSHWAFEYAEPVDFGKWSPWAARYLDEMKKEGRWKVLLSPVADLLKEFDPRFWADIIREKRYEYVGGYPIPFESVPQFMLKVQMALLDISIRDLLHTIWKTQKFKMPYIGTEGLYLPRLFSSGNFINLVMEAMLATVKKRPEGSELFEGLEEELHSKLFDETVPWPESREQAADLADLFRVRVLLYTAYLLVIQDSSDILELEQLGTDFVLPMI
ncbi:hypothetical protein GGS20DRAFT_462188 [Poronia punctata]|nr:hypothetical protein GGS20DRAFT_462188 [Poronia punctata]